MWNSQLPRESEGTQIMIVPNVRGSSLDPRAQSDGTTTKVGIDATAPLSDRWKFEKVT
jgi:2,5-furandicarboxylate decarboxylase 1